MPYNFKLIEQKWQKKWQQQPELYRAKDNDSSKQKKYVLVEFPYPSGEGLHIGHTFTMTGADVYARFCRMRGYNTLFPMGWDAFGLPTENYAIKNKIAPAVATKNNTDRFREQMKRLAFSFDWEREINTTDPDYYKWTQWIFIQLFKKGLAYKQEMPINWCPSCRIGLANEEVIDGKCERCGAETTKKTLSQWLLKITAYADRLIDELDQTQFPARVKASQINWIDRSIGAKVNFKVKDSDQLITVFTTRPDTLHGATFVVISPEHPITKSLLENLDIKEYVEASLNKTELERSELNKEKTGVNTGLFAINPVNGKEIPIWVSDFVLSSYGTGAIMSVPAHDKRDYEFSKKFNLPIIPVIQPNEKEPTDSNSCYEGSSGTLINSGEWDGLVVPNQMDKVIDWLVANKVGEKATSYHLRDWIFSRQHYWGEPIPMVYCPKCNWQPVSEDQLPVELPQVDQYEPTDTGASPLSTMTDWVNTTCPVCGGPATRETDTMPNWAGSSWYYLRYLDPHNNHSIGDIDKFNYWQPVDVYVGGDEHTTLHLLYSRFWHKFLNDLKLVPGVEPYLKRLVHGVILAPDGSRMSKSRPETIIIPDDVANQHGVDATRVYLMFIGPFDGVMAWNERALQGVVRFLNRIDDLVTGKSNERRVTSNGKEVMGNESVDLLTAKLVKKITDDISSFKFNTAVAAMMEYLNKVTGNEKQVTSREDIKVFVRLLAPFAPYLAEELWEQLGEKESVHEQSWPGFDSSQLVEDTVEVPVQINGKVKGVVAVSAELEGDQLILVAKADPKIASLLEGKKIIKEVGVRGKVVSFLVG